jgi:hypothetical protein
LSSAAALTNPYDRGTAGNATTALPWDVVLIAEHPDNDRRRFSGNRVAKATAGVSPPAQCRHVMPHQACPIKFRICATHD